MQTKSVIKLSNDNLYPFCIRKGNKKNCSFKKARRTLRSTLNSFLIKSPSAKFLSKSLTSNKLISEQKGISTPSGYFPFFITFFCWNEINQKSSIRRHEKDQKQSTQPATLFKKRLCHRCFPVKFAKFLKTSFLTEHLQWLLSKRWKIAKPITLQRNLFTEVTGNRVSNYCPRVSN